MKQQEKFVKRQIQLAKNARESQDHQMAYSVLEDTLNSLATDETSNLLAAEILVEMASLLNALTHEEAVELGFENRRNQAAKFTEKALGFLEKSTGVENLHARALVAAGIASWFIDGVDAAEKYFTRALKILKPVYCQYKLQYAETLQNKALCRQTCGDYAAAIPLYLEALEVAEEEGLEHTITDIKRRLANAYHDEGRISLAGEMLTSIRPGADASAEAQIRWLHARALLYDSEGRFRQADGLFDNIHNLFEGMTAIGPELGAALTNAAMFKLENGWPSQAKTLLELAEKIDQRHAPFSFRINFLKARAHLALRTQRPHEAVAMISTAQKLVCDGLEDDEEQRLELMLLERQALQQCGDDLDIAGEISRVLPVNNSIASIDCLSGGRLDALVALTRMKVFENDGAQDARKLLRLLLRAEAARNNPDLRWVIFYSLAALLARNGREATAILSAKLAVETIHTMLGALPFNTPQREAVLKSRLDAFSFLNQLLLAHGKFPESQVVQSLLSSDIVANIAPFKRQFKVNAPNVPYTDMEAGITRQYRKNAVSAHELHNQPDSSDRTGSLIQRDHHLDEIAKFYDRLWQEKKPVSSLLDADVELDFPLAKKGSKILRFAANGNVVRVFLTGDKGSVFHQVEEDLPEISAAVHALHKSVSCGLADWKSWSGKLYDLLLRRFDAEFEHTKELQISAKGIFSRIPFAALFDGREMLIEKFPLIYRTFIAADSPPEQREFSSVLALGTSQQLGDFPPLSNVRSELLSLAGNFRKTEVLIDRDFTHDAFVNGLKDHPDVVHLATHFQLQPGSPQRSYLLLGDGESLPLSVIGSEQFDWTGVSLAFLSACETGTADHETFEGGTIAAYLQTLGAEWTIATLWSIFDHATEILVKQFYDQLVTEKCPAKALQKAQVSMLKPALKTASENQHPENWAGFKVFGPGH